MLFIIQGLTIMVVLTVAHCRKSDYKRIIFSEFVKDEMERNFRTQLDDYKMRQPDVVDLYEKLWQEQRNAKLVRLQPELVCYINK